MAPTRTASAHYQDPIIPVAHFSEGDLEQSQKSDDYQDDPRTTMLMRWDQPSQPG